MDIKLLYSLLKLAAQLAIGKITLPRFAVLLAVGLSVCFWPSIFGGKVLLPLDLLWQCPPHTSPDGVEGIHNFLIGDMVYQNLTWKTLLRESVADGELPLWNPYTFCGHPLYATGQASTFYPLNLIFLLVPLPYAYVVFTGLHLWLAGLFQYLFLRRIGVSEFGSAVGGTVFAMCGFFAMRLIWPMLLGSGIWLPLMMICIIKLAEVETLRQATIRVAAGAIVFALPLLAGFFEIAFYAGFVAGMFTLALCVKLLITRRSFARCIALCAQALAVVVFAALLAGPQLMPFIEVKDRTTRVGEADYDKTLGRALRAEHLWPVIFPDFFGHPAKHHTWDLRTRRMVPIDARGNADYYHYGTKNYSENGYYLGLLPLALAVISLRVRGHHRLFLYVLLAFSLALAFGTRWLYAPFFNAVPGFEQVRTPFRWMYPATFAVASLAAIGAGHWYERLRRGSASLPARAIGSLLVAVPVIMLVTLLGLILSPEPVYRLALRAMTHWREFFTYGFGFRSPWDLAGFMWANALRFTAFTLAAAIVLALPYLSSWSRRGAAVAGLACLSLIFADPGLANYRFMTHSDPAWLDRVPASVKHLQGDADTFRIARFGPGLVLHPQLPALYGLHDVGGYDSVILADYARYLGAIEPQRRLWYNQIVAFRKLSSLDSPLFSLLNVRYMLTAPGVNVGHPDWEPVFDEGEGMRIYRNQYERPRAFMVHRAESVESLDEAIRLIADGTVDPGETAVVEHPPEALIGLPTEPVDQPGRVEIRQYRRNRVDLRTYSKRPGIAVLCDMMYPGWRAYVNDRPADIMKVDGIFRGVCVPAGEHSVSFRFDPERLRWGESMLYIGLAILGVAIVGSHLARPKRGRA